jgi:hypothetical protein
MNSGTFTVENSYNPDDDSNEMTTNVSAEREPEFTFGFQWGFVLLGL